MSKEIELYYSSTPNSWKVEIALEELELPYKINYIDCGKGDQYKPEYLKINPNNKVPAIVDPNVKSGPLSIFESGAILIHLAQKTGKFLPDSKKDPAGHSDVLQWLMWQMSAVGPMFGQYFHFAVYAPEKIPYALGRYQKEIERLLKVLDTQLSTSQFVAKSGYSIADIALFGWISVLSWGKAAEIPTNVNRWHEDMMKRPVIAKLALKYQENMASKKPYTEEEKKVLFKY